MSADFAVEVRSKLNPTTGIIEFYTFFDNPPANINSILEVPDAFVNLSRGGTRMYRLDKLSEHNTSGADWNNPDDGVHGQFAYEAYVERTTADIQRAVNAVCEEVRRSLDCGFVVARGRVAPTPAAVAPQDDTDCGCDGCKGAEFDDDFEDEEFDDGDEF